MRLPMLNERETSLKILMVLTSHDRLGDTGRKTGFWLEEFAAPYFVFRDAGVELTLASPKGGQPPIDPKSDLPENQTPAMTRFRCQLETVPGARTFRPAGRRRGSVLGGRPLHNQGQKRPTARS